MLAVAALGALRALGLFGRDMLRLAQNHLALTKRWEQAYVDGADDANRGIADERGTLPRPKEGNETWYVLGDPLWYPALGVDQGLPINGWSPEQFVPAQWDRLRAEMGQFHPDRVLVDDFSYDTIVERDPKTLALLQARYDLAGKTSGGSKQAVSEYVLRSAP